MTEKIKKLFKLNIIKYFLCSIFTMLLEMIIGLLMIRLADWDVVIINSISVVIGAVVHYILISKKVFYNTIDISTVVKYVLSFGFCLFLQNLVLFVFYSHILIMCADDFRYAASKIMSVGIPFVITYFIRKYLFMNKETDEENV